MVDVHSCPIGHVDDNFQGKAVTEYIGIFRPDSSEDCAEISRKCEAGTFSNAFIRLLERTIFIGDRIGLRFLQGAGLAPTTPTLPKMSWIMSDIVGDGRFLSDFMTRAKKLNRETFNEVVIPFLKRHMNRE